MQAPTEVFFCRIPGSNFSGTKGNIIFTPDKLNSSIGRYETADAMEIAELRAAIKGGAPTIYQDPTQLPYSKSAHPVDTEEQQKNVDKAGKEIEARRQAEMERLRNLPAAGSAAPEQAKGGANTGVQNSAAIAAAAAAQAGKH